MQALAIKCDTCGGVGYTGGEQCWKCDGNGRVMVGTPIEPLKLSRGPRIIAYVAFILLCGLAAYLIGHGGR
jgi:hypothetical protein